MIFSCARCAKRYTLADAKVPPRGFRCTCTDCGHTFVVRPAAAPAPAQPPPPPPRPPPRPPPAPAPPRVARAAPPPAAPILPAATPPPGARAATSTPATTSPPPAHQHQGHHVDGAPGSHHAATTGSLVLALTRRRGASHQAWIASTAIAVVGLTAGGLWWSRQGGDDAVPVTAAKVQGGGSGRRSVQPPPVAIVAPMDAAPVEPAQPQRGAAATPARTPQPGQDALHRAGAPIGRKDKGLLDLLQRKEDAPVVATPAGGDPGAGRASLDTGRATLDEAAIRNTLAASSSAFSACIARAGKADQGLRQDRRPPVLELVVRPTGRVARATLSDPAWARSALGQCLAAAAQRMIFPSFEGQELRVQAPLKLSAVQ